MNIYILSNWLIRKYIFVFILVFFHKFNLIVLFDIYKVS